MSAKKKIAQRSKKSQAQAKITPLFIESGRLSLIIPVQNIKTADPVTIKMTSDEYSDEAQKHIAMVSKALFTALMKITKRMLGAGDCYWEFDTKNLYIYLDLKKEFAEAYIAAREHVGSQAYIQKSEISLDLRMNDDSFEVLSHEKLSRNGTAGIVIWNKMKPEPAWKPAA